MDVIETKFEFFPCSKDFAFNILHFNDSRGIGVRGGSEEVPPTWLFGTKDVWLLIFSIIKLVFIGSDSFSVLTIVWFLGSKGCWSLARDFNKESTKGEGVGCTLESEDFVLHWLDWRCKDSSSSKKETKKKNLFGENFYLYNYSEFLIIELFKYSLTELKYFYAY